MKETEGAQGVAQAKELYRTLEDNNRAMREFLNSATLVQSAYTQALGRVTQALSALGRSLRGVATAGLNLAAGLLQAMEPVAQTISNLVTRIFGVTVWKAGSKAMEGTAASLGKVAKATRSAAQAQRQLYSFDQITRVDPPSSGSGSSGGSGGSGSGGGGSSAVEGEWIHIPGLIEQWAVRAKQILAQIWQPFQAAWESQGAGVLEAARFSLSELSKTAAALGASWLEVWTDGTGEKMVSTLLQILQRVCETVGQLASRFREAWTAGDVGTGILKTLAGIGLDLLETLRDMAAATAVWAGTLDFSGLVNGCSKLLEAVRPLVELVTGGLQWCYVNVLLPLSSWVIQSAGPATLNLLTSGVNLLTSALNLLKPVGTAIWEYFLKPMGNWTGTLLLTALNQVTQAFQALSNALNALPGTWESIRSKASNLWQSIQTAITGAANNARTGAVNAFAALTSGVNSQGNSLKSKVSSIFGSVASSVKSKLSSLGSAMTTPFKNGFNSVVSLLNRLIGKINSALKFSWKAIKILGKTIVPAGSVTLAKLPTVSKLAKGGITQGATLSLIGEAGREAVLPLEQNTGWMDQLAARLAQAVRGGETRVEVYVGGRQLTEQVIREVNSLTARTGRCPIYL